MSRASSGESSGAKPLQGKMVRIAMLATPLMSNKLSTLRSLSQLTIVNPKHLEVPEEKGKVLLSTACRVVAQEFHVSDPSALRFSLVLVLGEKEEH